MARYTASKAEITIKYPVIEGKRWQLYSSHGTKKEAEDRAKTVRKVYKKARVRLIPKGATQFLEGEHRRLKMRYRKFGKWGVYHP